MTEDDVRAITDEVVELWDLANAEQVVREVADSYAKYGRTGGGNKHGIVGMYIAEKIEALEH